MHFIDFSMIFFDEIQVCPNARTSLKSFAIDGRYDVIVSGSLLGPSYGQDVEIEEEIKSIPVGYEKEILMKSMDFEEFLWAIGIDAKVYENLIACMLVKNNYKLNFFKPKENDKEIEFLISKNAKIIPIEVKARNGATISLNDYIEEYKPIKAYKFIDGNIGTEGVKIILPHYMAMFL